MDSMDPLGQDYRERAAVEGRLREAIVGSDAMVKTAIEELVGDTGPTR